jgi:hypothetical protein
LAPFPIVVLRRCWPFSRLSGIRILLNQLGKLSPKHPFLYEALANKAAMADLSFLEGFHLQLNIIIR